MHLYFVFYVFVHELECICVAPSVRECNMTARVKVSLLLNSPLESTMMMMMMMMMMYLLFVITYDADVGVYPQQLSSVQQTYS